MSMRLRIFVSIAILAVAAVGSVSLLAGTSNPWLSAETVSARGVIIVLPSANAF